MATDRDLYRLFVACELPPPAREALAALQRSLREAAGATTSSLRWVRPEGIHLTLKFLGPVQAGRVAATEAALAGAVTGPLRLAVRLSGVGSFGGPARLRVVWAGMEGDVAALGELAGRVDAALARLDFPPEQRPFAPHLTLARVRDDASPEDRRRLHAVLRDLPAPTPQPFTLDSVSLMRSFLEPGGARYVCLARFPRDTAQDPRDTASRPPRG